MAPARPVSTDPRALVPGRNSTATSESDAGRSEVSGASGGCARYSLPPLPYAESALAPVISGRTLRYHHGKHHAGYVEKLNELIRRDPLEGKPLEDLVRALAARPHSEHLFNPAAQAWNHAFLWQCLSPAGGRPAGALRAHIERDFGGYDAMAEKLTTAAVDQFGSGWAWLVLREGRLEISTTSDADTPLAHGTACILALDVWEHAYYLDYQNRREAYVRAVIAERLNWSFAAENLRRAST